MMDALCLCGHTSREHDFANAPGICMVWLEEDEAWCPCVEFSGTTGTNSTNVTIKVSY